MLRKYFPNLGDLPLAIVEGIVWFSVFAITEVAIWQAEVHHLITLKIALILIVVTLIPFITAVFFKWMGAWVGWTWVVWFNLYMCYLFMACVNKAIGFPWLFLSTVALGWWLRYSYQLGVKTFFQSRVH